MSGQVYCVVGTSGFVGSHVAAELLRRGHSVHGTLRNASNENTGWIRTALDPLAADGRRLELFSADVFDTDSLAQAMAGCDGVVMCAGSVKQEPATVELMVAAAENTLDCAADLGIGRAVLTSSTGSTNPPDGEPEMKNEIEHWSDPDIQLAAEKYAATGKTRMDRAALARMEASGGALRVAILNPSLIAGPCFQPEPVTSLRRFEAILKGEQYADRAPNSSMSMVDVRDLAALHAAALENEKARGRYFAVKQSWHWQEILAALARVYPDYRPPAAPADQTPARPTRFDLTRQRSLGVELRDLDEILAGVVEELKRRDMI